VKNQFRSILVRRIDNLGDIIIFLPVLRELKRNFPDALISAMVKPDHRPLLNGYADNFILPAALRTLQNLKYKYDMVMNVEYSFPEGYQSRSPKKNSIIHIGTPDWNRKKHIYKHLLDGLKHHGFEVNYTKPKILLSKDSKRIASKWFKDNNLTKQHFIVALNPGSRLAKKIWPLKNYYQICKWLIDEFDARIIVVGRSSREKHVAGLYTNLPNRNRHLLVKKPIDQVAAIINKTDLFIGNDSGTSHLAAALDLSSVTIFGPSAPGYWRPAGRKSVIVYNHKLCSYHETPDFKKNEIDYFVGVTPESVIDGILLSLNQHINRTSKTVLNRIMVTSDLEIEDTISGVILKNRITKHACLVNHGWKYVARYLDCVNTYRSISLMNEKFPQDIDLLNLLLLHQIIESNKIKSEDQFNPTAENRSI